MWKGLAPEMEFHYPTQQLAARKEGKRFDIDCVVIVIEQIIDLKTCSGSGVLQNRILRQILFEGYGSVVSIH